MSSSFEPLNCGVRSLTRARRASAPSTASTIVDATSQRKARRKLPPMASVSARYASSAPLAVNACTSQAPIIDDLSEDD